MSSIISKDILSFFKKLEKNNNREWFTEHKPTFKALESDVKSFYQRVFENLQKHDDVDQIKVFRIYRDVRFSKNKTPYKTHFGGSFGRTKPRLRGGYYVHIAPNNESFLATGFWQPHKDDLLRIRKELELDASEFRTVIGSKKFKESWGTLEGDEVKTSPKGFDKSHPDIDLIKKKQFIFTKKYSDKEVTSPNFINEIDIAFRAIRPYFDYMTEVLTTDLNGVSLID